MSTDEKRVDFVGSLWLERDPTPDSIASEYKDEHYRRITYAIERFAVWVSGWRTDRGRTYILQGPPDEIESHPSGGRYGRPPREDRGFTASHPFEVWRYRGEEGGGRDTFLELVDPAMTGEYRLRTPPSGQ